MVLRFHVVSASCGLLAEIDSMSITKLIQQTLLCQTLGFQIYWNVLIAQKVFTHTYNDFRTHVQKLYPVTLIDCPCCGRRKIPSYDSFRHHYFREHKDYLSEKPQPDVQNVEELQTAHNDSFSGSEDEDMPLCDEDTTLRQEREMLKIDLVAKLMLIQGKHGMPQGMIFKLQRSLLSI